MGGNQFGNSLEFYYDLFIYNNICHKFTNVSSFINDIKMLLSGIRNAKFIEFYT